jgi:hypothetical protein
MAATLGAMHFGPHHEKRTINMRSNGTIQRRVKGRPARAAFILGGGIKQRSAAATAKETASAFFRIQGGCAWPFGAVLAQDPKGFG